MPIPNWLKEDILFLSAYPPATVRPGLPNAGNELPAGTIHSDASEDAVGLSRMPKELSVSPEN